MLSTVVRKRSMRFRGARLLDSFCAPVEADCCLTLTCRVPKSIIVTFAGFPTTPWTEGYVTSDDAGGGAYTLYDVAGFSNQSYTLRRGGSYTTDYFGDFRFRGHWYMLGNSAQVKFSGQVSYYNFNGTPAAWNLSGGPSGPSMVGAHSDAWGVYKDADWFFRSLECPDLVSSFPANAYAAMLAERAPVAFGVPCDAVSLTTPSGSCPTVVWQNTPLFSGGYNPAFPACTPTAFIGRQMTHYEVYRQILLMIGCESQQLEEDWVPMQALHTGTGAALGLPVAIMPMTYVVRRTHVDQSAIISLHDPLCSPSGPYFLGTDEWVFAFANIEETISSSPVNAGVLGATTAYPAFGINGTTAYYNPESRLGWSGNLELDLGGGFVTGVTGAQINLHGIE